MNKTKDWCEDWVPKLSSLCLSLAKNINDPKTGEIGSFRSIARLFRDEIKIAKKRAVRDERMRIIKLLSCPECDGGGYELDGDSECVWCTDGVLNEKFKELKGE